MLIIFTLNVGEYYGGKYLLSAQSIKETGIDIFKISTQS